MMGTHVSNHNTRNVLFYCYVTTILNADDRVAIKKHLRTEKTSPLTNKGISVIIKPNHAMKSQIEEYKTKRTLKRSKQGQHLIIIENIKSLCFEDNRSKAEKDMAILLQNMNKFEFAVPENYTKRLSDNFVGSSALLRAFLKTNEELKGHLKACQVLDGEMVKHLSEDKNCIARSEEKIDVEISKAEGLLESLKNKKRKYTTFRQQNKRLMNEIDNKGCTKIESRDIDKDGANTKGRKKRRKSTGVDEKERSENLKLSNLMLRDSQKFVWLDHPKLRSMVIVSANLGNRLAKIIMKFKGWYPEKQNMTGAFRDYEAYMKDTENDDEMLKICRHQIGLCKYMGWGTHVQKEEAISILEKNAISGNYDNSQVFLSGVADTEVKKKYWAMKAYENGNAAGALKMALSMQEFTEYSPECTPNALHDSKPESVVSWMAKAASEGVYCAEYWMGRYALIGFGMERDIEKAAKWFKKAAEKGHAASAFELGRTMVNILTDRNITSMAQCGLDEAVKWLRASADAGYTWAQEYLDLRTWLASD